MDKVIFWDFDGTLVKANERFVLAYDSAIKKANYIIDIENVRKFLQTVYPWLNYNNTYENATNLWWENFLSSLTPFYVKYKIQESDYQKINSNFRYTITKINDYILYEDTKNVLSQCNKLGYKNYLLSNNFPELEEMIKALRIDKYFSNVFVSGNIGYEKPREEIFAFAKKHANCTSGIMVGDNPIADILGAKKAGLTTVFVHKDCPSEADYNFATLTQILDIL